MSMGRWWIGGCAVGCVAMLVLAFGPTGSLAQYDYSQPAPAPKPGPAGAKPTGGLQAELSTALTHAGFAAKYDALPDVTMHLHHVVNCIVGSKDKMFDPSAGNPCQGQGNGILADLQSGKGKDQRYYEAWWVAYVANQAVMMKNLPQAKAAAHVAIDVLTDVQKVK